MTFGKKLLRDHDIVGSVAVFAAAATVCENGEQTAHSVQVITQCVEAMREANVAMVQDASCLKEIVKDFVIPLMRQKMLYIKSSSSVSEYHKCLNLASVFLDIAHCEGLSNQLNEQEQTLIEAKQTMDDVFGNLAVKQKIYGNVLNNLGCAYYHKSLFREAASFFEQAIEANKAATDFGDEKRRKQCIMSSEKSLRGALQNIPSY